MGKIIGTIHSQKGIKYYVRYDNEDETASISEKQSGPWWIVADKVLSSMDALAFAQDYIDKQGGADDSAL